MSEQLRDIVARHPKMPARKVALLVVSILLCAVGVLGVAFLLDMVAEYASMMNDGAVHSGSDYMWVLLAPFALGMLIALFPGISGLLLFRKSTPATRTMGVVSAVVWAIACLPLIILLPIEIGNVLTGPRIVIEGAAPSFTTTDMALLACAYAAVSAVGYPLCVALCIRKSKEERG